MFYYLILSAFHPGNNNDFQLVLVHQYVLVDADDPVLSFLVLYYLSHKKRMNLRENNFKYIDFPLLLIII